MSQTIFHAHNWSFSRVLEHLDDFVAAGFDGVQLSPAQKSPTGDAWYLRYQPYDYLEINGLGDRRELTMLCREARRRGLRVIADLVFNHMAVPDGTRRDLWHAAAQHQQQGKSEAIDQLYDKLKWFPNLTLEDFQPWRDMQGGDWDNEHRYESWGNGEWPELRPTKNVLSLHNRHLDMLYECGIRGFRFDAVKHMRASHLAEYVQTICKYPEPCWYYGEVLSDDLEMHGEYNHLFPTTDFPFIQFLKRALVKCAPIELDPSEAFLSPASIRFGNNHDLACNPKHLMAGLLFDQPEHTRLANCLALVLSGGTALVFADDHQNDAMIRQCIAFRRETSGLLGTVSIVRLRSSLWEIKTANDGVILDFTQERLERL